MLLTWRDFRTGRDIRELDNVREKTSHALQSQYAASPRILRIGASMQDWLDPTIDIGLVYESWVDIMTAKGVGLDNWGRILQIGRKIEYPKLEDCFGFAGQEMDAFNELPFDRELESQNIVSLEDEAYRLLLLYKAMANIAQADARSLNGLLQALMDTGVMGLPKTAYALEPAYPMTIRFVFEDRLNPMQIAIFRAIGIYARGAGVGWELYATDPKATFGFAGSNMQPFIQGAYQPDHAFKYHSDK